MIIKRFYRQLKDGLMKNIQIDDQQFELLLPNYLVTGANSALNSTSRPLRN